MRGEQETYHHPWCPGAPGGEVETSSGCLHAVRRRFSRTCARKLKVPAHSGDCAQDPGHYEVSTISGWIRLPQGISRVTNFGSGRPRGGKGNDGVRDPNTSMVGLRGHTCDRGEGHDMRGVDRGVGGCVELDCNLGPYEHT